jgi:hypothetical protein
MLRFDVPRVHANVIRWEAFLTHVICWLAWFTTPWLMLLPAAQGLVRGVFGHHRCPSHGLWKRAALALGRAGKLEDAGAKMFANKLLFIASTVSLLLYASGSAMWQVPVAVLLVFSFLEWALSFCAACWVYGAWYKRFPPSGA